MTEGHNQTSERDPLAVLAGGGEMGTLIRRFDWSHTPLGPIESWPGSLRTTVSICLNSDLPICIIWGPGLVQIYNDGYRVICGDKHPRSLGQNFPECWREAWPVIGEAHDSALAGHTAFLETQRIFLDRHGYTEECFFTFSFSPIRDHGGHVGGLFHPVIEMTAKMHGERRTQALRDVASRTANATTVEQACALATGALAGHDRDVPFALLYLLDADGQTARLAASAGMSNDGVASVARVAGAAPAWSSWPLAEVARTGQTQVIDDVQERLALLACGPYPEVPRVAVALALKPPGSDRPVGVLVTGVSARLKLTPAYRDFHELLAAAVTTALANGRAFGEERRKAEALAEQLGAGRSPASTGMGAMPYVEEALRWLPDEAESRSELPTYREALPVPYLGDERHDDTRPRVLVADDNADMRHYVVRLLAEHFRTEAVADGEAALTAARRNTPDLILTDVMMPRLDGFGLLRALRGDPLTSGVPVIMLSVRAGEESRVEGMEAGADDYLVKPFGARELLARVTAHLQMARLRRDASEALRQSRDRLRMALTAARMLAWQFEPDTGTLVVSDNADEILGLPVGTTLEHDDAGFAALHPDDVQARRAKVMTAIEECGSYFSQYRIIRQDNGVAQWMEERGHAIRRSPGEPVRLVGVVTDISERKLIEGRMQAKEQQTRTILESITDGFFALDHDWRFTFVNLAGERFLNRAHGDLTGKRVWDEYPGTVGSEFERVYRRVASLRVAESFTAHYPDLDCWYEVSAYPAPEGLSVYFRDVTAQKLAEEQLKASEERRRLALDGAELGAWNVDPVTRVTKTDARFREIFATTEEWTDYLQIFAVIHPDDLPAVQVAVAAATRLDDPLPYSIEYRIIHPDGSLHWVFAKGRSIVEGTGSARRVVSFDGTVADISARKRVEEERESLFNQLQEQDTRKDEFLATLAHELRNPLAPLSNGLQIIRLSGSTGRIEQARVMMDRQLTQMTRLVDDLLDVSRITRGKLELRKARVEVRAVIDVAVEIARPLIDQAGHELTVALPDEPTFVDGDVTRLAQVVSNLLTNSAKYTHQGGHIRLTVERADDWVRVSVKDNGIGIPVAMLERVFEMFTQVDRTLEKTTGGLGIGLSLAKGLVAMHGGNIEARSEGEGRGSEFVVRLPVVPSRVREPGAMPAGRRRVLVVDDNKDAADSLAHVLKLRGNEVRTAYDGEAGIAAAEVFRPDVVLLDIGMPKLNGYDACRCIREKAWARDIVLVAMTGWGQEEDQRRSLDAGFSAHLVKPVDNEILLELMASTDGRPATR